MDTRLSKTCSPLEMIRLISLCKNTSRTGIPHSNNYLPTQSLRTHDCVLRQRPTISRSSREAVALASQAASDRVAFGSVFLGSEKTLFACLKCVPSAPAQSTKRFLLTRAMRDASPRKWSNLPAMGLYSHTICHFETSLTQKSSSRCIGSPAIDLDPRILRRHGSANRVETRRSRTLMQAIKSSSGPIAHNVKQVGNLPPRCALTCTSF